jgi:O-antigen ligase
MAVLATQAVVYMIQSTLGMNFSFVGTADVLTGDMKRFGGTISSNPHGFCNFILQLFFLPAAFYIVAERKSQYAALQLLCALVLVLTYTRAAWLAAALGFTVLFAVAIRQGRLQPRALLRIVVPGMAVVLFLLPSIKNRLDADSTSSAYDERAALMKMATNVWSSHPILGAGIGNYTAVLKDNITPDVEGFWVAVVHNAYLLRAAETGLVGLIPYLGLLIAGLRTSARATRVSDPKLAAAALAIFAGQLAVSWEMYWDIWGRFLENALLWCLWGVMAAIERVSRENQIESERGAT